MNTGERIIAAIARLPRDHDFGITWDHDSRTANVASGINVFAGFPYAQGRGEHLDRAEAVALALEILADNSEKRKEGD